MNFSGTYVLLILTVTSVFLEISLSAPAKNRYLTVKELEEIIVRYLEEHYTMRRSTIVPIGESLDIKKKNVDIYDTMQGDQPVENNVEIQGKTNNSTGNFTDLKVLQASRNRFLGVDFESRTKDNWIELLKMNILQQVGRVNSSGASMLFNKSTPLNVTQFFPNNSNETNALEEFISKKIRTFYPSCSVPEIVNQDFKSEEKMMNLFFNYTQDDRTNHIAEATLRLHAMILKNTTITAMANCTHQTGELEKVYRVSAYYYVRNQKNKRRAKKRLCDSKVVSETSRYVELNMANAVRAWNNEQNLGLAVEMEDQDGKTMKTEKYFKGPSCLQPQGQSQASSSTTQELRSTFSEYWEEIQRRPLLVIYHCYPPLRSAPWDLP